MSITKLGKKMLSFVALIALVFVLFGCQNNSQSDKTEKRDEAKQTVETALKKLLWAPEAMDNITDNLNLVSSVAGVSIEWSSSVPDVISTTGEVNQPSPSHEKAEAVYKTGTTEVDYYHVPVKLVATAEVEYTYESNGEEKTDSYKKSKNFEFTVLCFDGDFGTIAEVKANAYDYIYNEKKVDKALVSASDTTYSVGFYGVVTAKLNSDGSGQFMVHDGTAGIYVYKSADVKVGDTVYVTGDIYSYYGSLQVGSNIAVKVVEDRGIEVPEYTEKTIDAWEQERAGDNLQNVIGYLGGDLYKLYAKVESEYNETTKDQYKLLDPYTGETAWVYYKSYSTAQEEILKSYVGKYVIITGVTYDRDSRILKNHLLWDGGIEEAEAPTLTDEDKLSIAVKEVEALAGSYASYSKLVLPVENKDVDATIAWDIPSDAPYADNAFTEVANNTDVTFKATVTVGELTQVVEVKITVKKLTTATVDEAVKLEKGDVVQLSGTVDVLFSSYKNYYLKDATGNILVYVGTKDGIKVGDVKKTVNVGDKVEFIGVINYFNGTPQIGSIIKYVSHEEATWNMSVPTEATIAEIVAATSKNAPYGQYLMVEGVVVADTSGDTTYYYLAESQSADAKKISLYYSTVPEAVTAVAGTDTRVTLFVYFYGNQKADFSGDVRVIFSGREGEYFVGDEEVVMPEPSHDTIITELKEGVAYNYSLIQKNKENARLYFLGEMSGNFYQTTEHGYEAAKLYVEKVEGGYHVYFLNGETKTYINLEASTNSNTGKDTSLLSLGTTPLNVWTWNSEYNTIVTTVTNQVSDGTTTYYLGAYNTYTTMSGSNVKYASTSFVGHFYTASKEVAPDPKPDPDPIVKTEIETDFEVKTYEELGALVPNKDDATTEKYYVAGYVKEITNDTYGNMDIEDVAGNIWKIYGLYNADGKVRFDAMTTDKPKVGDAVVIYGILSNYNGTKQTKNGWLVQLGEKVLEGTVVPANQVVFTWVKDTYTTDGNTLVIAPANADYEIVINKAESNTNINVSAAQLRVYQGSSFAITAKNGKKITKIEFTDVHDKNAVINCSDKNVSVSNEGKAWTISCETGTDEIVLSYDKQWRVTSITITFAE